MSEMDLIINLDKLLIELGFQLEQDSQNKEHLKEQIQMYMAKALDKKQQICELRKHINNSDKNILNLQKYNKCSHDNCVAWKPTYTVFKKHEEFLESQLESVTQALENDKKLYHETVSKYKETLKHHQAEYTGSPKAKEYYLKKQELEEIQCRLLKYAEHIKREEKNILDTLGSPPFKSYNEWALQIASLKKNTKEVLKHTALITFKTSDMTRGAEELELKLKYFIQCIKNMPEDQSNSENKSTDKNNSVAFQEGTSDEEMDLNSSDGKPQPRELPIPCLPQKLMWPKRDIKLSLQLTRTAREEKEHSMDQISSSDIPSKEKINQISEPFICDESIPYGTPVLPASLSSQRQLRLVPLQKKIYHQLEITKTVELTEEGKKTSHIPMDSAYASQDSHSKYFKAKEDNIPRNKDTSPRKFSFPRKSSFIPTICETPSSAVSTYSKNPVHNFANKGQNYKSGKDEMIESTCEQPEKLQSFNLLVASTPKMSSLNIFESSAFGTQDLPDQDENVTEGNTNTGSPLKSIGNIFEKMGENDEFTLPFASKPPQHFDDEKDDFGFTFPFGQDQKAPQDFSFQEFETSESTMKFTFF